MREKKRSSRAISPTRNASKRITKPARKPWSDPDDAPELTDEMLARATLREGERIIRRGRPPLGNAPKSLVTLRLDSDLLQEYRESGPGWQSRINADLRNARKRKAS